MVSVIVLRKVRVYLSINGTLDAVKYQVVVNCYNSNYYHYSYMLHFFQGLRGIVIKQKL